MNLTKKKEKKLLHLRKLKKKNHEGDVSLSNLFFLKKKKRVGAAIDW
jgi:hypothetical protein